MSFGSDEINSSTEESSSNDEAQYSAIQIEEGGETPRIAIFNEDNADERIEGKASETFDLEVMR